MSPHTNLHRGLHRLTHKGLGQELLRDITIVLDKLTESSLKVTLSDDLDPCFLCALIITRNDYEELKKQQGLLVDFDNFPSQFVRLLQQCQNGNMFLSLYQDDPVKVYLEIIERNDFKKLVHLSLKMLLASDTDIKQNMADNITELKKKLANIQSKLENMVTTSNDKERFLESRVNDLTNLLTRASDEKLQRENEYHILLKKERERFDQEIQEFQKCADRSTKSHLNSLQDNLTKKEKQLEDSLSRCRHLQETVKSLESQINDKNQRMHNIEKQLHTAKIDAESWRNQNGALDRDYHDKDLILKQTKSRLADAEKALREKSDLLRDTLDSLHSIRREKATWEENANLLETKAMKKNLELQNINEQLLKANQIIAKQNADILDLREKVMCRTAIALEQEKVVNAYSTQISDLKVKEKELLEEIDNAKKEVAKVSNETNTIKMQLDDKVEIIKNNNEVIQWLHKKIDSLQSVKDIMATANCRMPTHEFNSTRIPPQIMEFDKNYNYECPSSRLSNLYIAGLQDDDKTSSESNPFTDRAFNNPVQEKEQYCIDPVYLKPSKGSSKTSSRSKSQDSQKSKSSQSRLPDINKMINNETKKTQTRTKSGERIEVAKRSSRENRYITGTSAYFQNIS